MNDVLQESESLVHTWVQDPTVVKFIVLIAGLLMLHFVTSFLKRTAKRRIENPDSVHTIRRLISIGGYIIAFILITSIFKDKLGGLSVAFGVAGAGIAFALQEVIASIAGWVALSLGNFYKLGDRVKLGGIKGDVIDIGVLRTTLMELGDWVQSDLYNGRIVRVANSFVFKEPVFNYSGDFPFLWDEITIPIKYGSNWELADKLLRESCDDVVGEYSEEAKKTWKDMVKTYHIENAMIDPMVTMVANDNWIEFTVRYVTNFKRRRTTKDQLFRSILKKVDANADQVGLASATFHLVESPPMMNVRMFREQTESAKGNEDILDLSESKQP
jgi:small-conductance mechanosensitive channel